MQILIENQQNDQKINLKKLRQTARAILNALDCRDGELSILIVDDARIEALNSQYLHRSGPTNVIAFPMQEGDFTDITPQLLGDVAISIQTAEKEAQAGGVHVEQRLYELLIHGILHLLGYDHEHDAARAGAMEQKSRDLMELIESAS